MNSGWACCGSPFDDEDYLSYFLFFFFRIIFLFYFFFFFSWTSRGGTLSGWIQRLRRPISLQNWRPIISSSSRPYRSSRETFMRKVPLIKIANGCTARRSFFKREICMICTISEIELDLKCNDIFIKNTHHSNFCPYHLKKHLDVRDGRKFFRDENDPLKKSQERKFRNCLISKLESTEKHFWINPPVGGRSFRWHFASAKHGCKRIKF